MKRNFVRLSQPNFINKSKREAVIETKATEISVWIFLGELGREDRQRIDPRKGQRHGDRGQFGQIGIRVNAADHSHAKFFFLFTEKDDERTNASRPPTELNAHTQECVRKSSRFKRKTEQMRTDAWVKCAFQCPLQSNDSYIWQHCDERFKKEISRPFRNGRQSEEANRALECKN